MKTINLLILLLISIYGCSQPHAEWWFAEAKLECVLNYTAENTEFSVSAQTGLPSGITIENGGTRLYVIDRTAYTIYQWNLSTPYSVSSKTYVGSKQLTGPLTLSDIEFSPNGDTLFVLNTTQSRIDYYVLNTNWLVTSSIVGSGSHSIYTDCTSCSYMGFDITDDGKYMYLIENGLGAENGVYFYEFGTPRVLSTLSFVTKEDFVGGTSGQWTSIHVNSQKTKLFLIQEQRYITDYTLVSAGGSPEGMELNCSVDMEVIDGVPSGDVIIFGVYFSPDMTKIYLTDTSQDIVRQLDNPLQN